MNHLLSEDYSDIIDHEAWRPTTRKRMSLEARGAQFAPFAALDKHADYIAEAKRTTEAMPQKSECDNALLNQTIAQLTEKIAQKPHVTISFFVHDSKKSGGKQCTHSGALHNIDATQRFVKFCDGTHIDLDAIIHIKIDD